MGIDIIEPLESGSDGAPTASSSDVEILRTGRSRRLVAGLGVLGLVALTVWLSRPQPVDEPEDAGPRTTIANPTTSARPGETEGERALLTAPSVIEFDAATTPDPPRLTLATGDDELTLWSVDLPTGRAEVIDVPPLFGELMPPPIVDVRFFGSDLMVAVDVDDRYHLLRFDGAAVQRERVVDLGTRDTFGITGLTRDGSYAWVGIPTGLIRWRLVDDQVDARWIDSFGDRTQLPDVRLVADRGLLVEGSGRNFLIGNDGSADLLDVSGEVITGASDWIVSRACDEAMRCGQLTLDDLASGESLTLNREYRFRSRCGLATPGVESGVAHLVAEYLGRLVLLTVGSGEPIVQRELHPAGIGCVDAVALDTDRIVIAHERAITLVTGDEVELIHLDRLGPIVAVGSGG